ncbi:hypothetical protein IKQ26_05880, partial [bacterium]|nr:hypothetical protein [bacterium]
GENTAALDDTVVDTFAISRWCAESVHANMLDYEGYDRKTKKDLALKLSRQLSVKLEPIIYKALIGNSKGFDVVDKDEYTGDTPVKTENGIKTLYLQNLTSQFLTQFEDLLMKNGIDLPENAETNRVYPKIHKDMLEVLVDSLSDTIKKPDSELSFVLMEKDDKYVDFDTDRER